MRISSSAEATSPCSSRSTTRQCRPCSSISAIAGALAERDELVGGGQASGQVLRRPVHDVQGREGDGQRSLVGAHPCRRNRLLGERPPTRLGGRVRERDRKPREQPHPKRSRVGSQALERLLEERNERLVDGDDRHAESGHTERRTREQLVARLLADEPRRLLEHEPGGTALARAQTGVAERDEDLGQACRGRSAAGETFCALEQSTASSQASRSTAWRAASSAYASAGSGSVAAPASA